MTAQELSSKITAFAVARTEALIARFLPDLGLPGFFCGLRMTGASEAPNLVSLLAHLRKLGIDKIASIPIETAISKILKGVQGRSTETFYSLFIGETLAVFGKFENNPLLSAFTEAERENIRLATDTTSIFDPETKQLRGWPNNYWAVLARCEYTRQLLGILGDDFLLKRSTEELERLLFRNPLGFFDDDREDRGRYDSYSADVHLFCEPLWPLMGSKKLTFNLRRHAELVEGMAMENGASFVFGRSIGALSLCLTMEFLSMAVERGLSSDPARALGLIDHAFTQFQPWFRDDLINAHREGNTEAYRGIHRVLQMSLDCLVKLCYTAEKLNRASVETSPSPALFPRRDEWVSFDSRHAGVWLFRNSHISFQLALTHGENADYVACPRSPGVLENPVGSPMLCGVPRLVVDQREYTAYGLPVHLEKTADSLTLTYGAFLPVSGNSAEPKLEGRRIVTYKVDADTLFVRESIQLRDDPQAISYFIPESRQRLHVNFESAHTFHADVLAVGGMPEWRSAWGGLERLHQIHFAPARQLDFSYSIKPL